MGVVCTNCRTILPAEGINASTDVAHCSQCNTVHKLSELADRSPSHDLDLLSEESPVGTRIEPTPDGKIIIASLRSFGTAMFFIPFALFWNAATWSMVTVAVTALIGIPPGSIVKEADTDEPLSQGMAWFMLLFATPFVLVGIGTATAAIGSLIGSINVFLSPSGARITTGFGPLRYTKRFDPNVVDVISEKNSSLRSNGKAMRNIVIEAGPKTIKFGSMLNDRRRAWVAAVLRSELLT